MNSFSDTVRLARLEKGWSQRELARRIGKSATYIHYLENGANPSAGGKAMTLSVEVVDEIARVLQMNRDEARLAAGYAPERPPDDGFFKGIEKLSPDRQDLARRQIRAIIDSLSEKEETDDDFDYVDDDFEETR